ncbi:unnamed protein product [Cunninghamella echinulata]
MLPTFNKYCIKENNIKRSNFECQLLPFGSFRIGGYLANADIDMVLLAPISVRRRDFFNFFPGLLKSQFTVNNIEVIPNATVPIIKCVVDSITVDISFVRLQMVTVPSTIDLLNDDLLVDLEKTCLLSMDGPRVSQFIFDGIDKNDLSIFRLVMQCIKHWATKRGLYGKPMGYLNGSAWTLLLLKVYFTLKSEHQSRYMNNTIIVESIIPSSTSPLSSPASPTTPTAPSSILIPPNKPDLNILKESSSTSSCSSTASSSSFYSNITFISLLKSFFDKWSTWPWPTPVTLTPTLPSFRNQQDVDYHKLAEFRNAFMPIVSPCYPISNAAPFITKSTLQIITREFDRASRILETKYDQHEDQMTKLFKATDIIKTYKHFIKVTVSTETIKSREIWNRRMTYNIPRLVELLETVNEVETIHPLTGTYSTIIAYRTNHEKFLLQQGLAPDNVDYAYNLNPGSLYLTYFVICLEFKDMFKRGNTVLDFTQPINTFTSEIDKKKNRKDSDVQVHVTAIKRREMAGLIQQCSGKK